SVHLHLFAIHSGPPMGMVRFPGSMIIEFPRRMNPLAARHRDCRIRALLPLLVVLAFAAAPAPARAGCGGHVAHSNAPTIQRTSLGAASPLDLIDTTPVTPPPRCSGPNCSTPTDQPPPATSWKAPHRIDVCVSIAALLRPESPSWLTVPASPIHSIG